MLSSADIISGCSGTLEYNSPHTCTAAAKDLYACGVLLFVLLVNQYPTKAGVGFETDGKKPSITVPQLLDRFPQISPRCRAEIAGLMQAGQAPTAVPVLQPIPNAHQQPQTPPIQNAQQQPQHQPQVQQQQQVLVVDVSAAKAAQPLELSLSPIRLNDTPTDSSPASSYSSEESFEEIMTEQPMATQRSGKPFKYQGIETALRALIMQPAFRRAEFTPTEIRGYMLEHWEACMPGWPPPQELTQNAADKPLGKINPYLNKKSDVFVQRSGEGWLGAPYWTLVAQTAPSSAGSSSAAEAMMQMQSLPAQQPQPPPQPQPQPQSQPQLQLDEDLVIEYSDDDDDNEEEPVSEEEPEGEEGDDSRDHMMEDADAEDDWSLVPGDLDGHSDWEMVAALDDNDGMPSEGIPRGHRAVTA